jgi:ATP-dependent DNA helicase RecQ
MKDIYKILDQYWGFTDFRPLQEDIINSVIEGKDTLALLPTGGGKSLTFQVPALAQEGICLVISPLIALMKDQVENLKKKDILAAAIYSGMSQRQIIQTLKNVSFGPYKFLYVSPERLETSLFLEYLPAMDINLIAVDEAHCISQWGYDFRPSYLRIAALREQLPHVPILALTASATTEVQNDIAEKLLFKQKNVLRQSFERKNLSYSVFRVDAKMNKLVDIVKKVPGCSIVYCKSRKRTVEVANLLQMHGLTAKAYHAGMLQEQRHSCQQEWIDNKVTVIACTNAFGMGIDKPDVRTVIHIDMPDCLENYYQEAGRAGRDGKKSYAVLLYDEGDVEDLKALHIKRYPSPDVIRQVYQSLVNYLQVPIHSGQDCSYNFHYDEFIKNFKLDSYQCLYAIKALEHDGWLDFNEKNYTPSTIVFSTTKDQLYGFQNDYPEYELLLTTLLRTYEGIFDYPAFISETTLSRLLNWKEEELKERLRKIAGFHIIRYHPQNEAPRIIFRKNRVKPSELTLNLLLYNKRKDNFMQRVNKIIAYTDSTRCRSYFINHYFGDDAVKNCGVCDNCLRSRSTNIGADEFEQISQSIKSVITASAVGFPDLVSMLKVVPKEKAKTVLNFLQAEGEISVDEKGKISWKTS